MHWIENMTKVSSTHLQGLSHCLTVTLAAADVAANIAREGNVSADAGPDDDAWQKALSKVRDNAYQEALEQCKFRAASEPEFDWVSAEPNKDFVFTVTLDVLPIVDLSGLDKLVIRSPETKVNNRDVTHALELLQQENKTFETVDRAAKTADRVVFDYSGTIDGNAFKGSKIEGASAVVGTEDTLAEMDAALVGRKPGESFSLPITFPDDHADSDLRGKCAQFDVVVQKVEEPQLPALKAKFVQQMGVESGSLEELRDQLRERLELECNQAKQRYERQQLSQGILDSVPVEIPETLIGDEVERLRQSFGMNTEGEEASEQQIPDAALEATAKRRLGLSLILSELMRQRNINLDEDQVEKKLDELAARYGDVESVKSRYRTDKQLMHNVRALVMEETGFAAALSTAKKTSVDMSFDELLRVDQENSL
jgi:trigger factor